MNTKIILITLSVLILNVSILADKTSSEQQIEPATYIHEVLYSFEETVQKTKDAISAANYRVFPDRYLEQGLTIDDTEVNKKQINIRFCNFKTLYEAIAIEPRLGVVLPCRITIIEDDKGVVKLITANISALSKLFENEKLKPLEAEIKESYSNIIEEVSL